jgi:ribosomal-protein-alanine N-acetyltransferase
MARRIRELHTERLTLWVAGPEDAERCVRFNRENAAFLRPWNPPFTHRNFDVDGMRDIRSTAVDDAIAGRRFSFAIARRDEIESGPILGFANLTEIVRSVFQACYLGYMLAENAQGQGYMTEAVRAVTAFAFNDLLLHRIMANYMPHNERSAAVLRRLGFSIEGTAKNYLYLDGAWRDHVLTSLTNPKPSAPFI